MTDLEQRVHQALVQVRIMVQQHDGDVELISLQDQRLVIKLMGACKGCPLSFFTLSAGIEEIIKKYAPEIVEIIAEE